MTVRKNMMTPPSTFLPLTPWGVLTSGRLEIQTLGRLDGGMSGHPDVVVAKNGTGGGSPQTIPVRTRLVELQSSKFLPQHPNNHYICFGCISGRFKIFENFRFFSTKGTPLRGHVNGMTYQRRCREGVYPQEPCQNVRLSTYNDSPCRSLC